MNPATKELIGMLLILLGAPAIVYSCVGIQTLIDRRAERKKEEEKRIENWRRGILPDWK